VSALPRDLRILLVAPPDPAGRGFEDELRAAGLRVERAAEPAAIEEGLASRPAGIVVDLDSPRLDGPGVLARALRLGPAACVVALVAAGNEERGLRALEQGAADFMVRPGSLRRLQVLLARAVERGELLERVRDLEAQRAEQFSLARVIGESRGMVRARDALRDAVEGGRSVLLVGEPGTGREFLARILHQATSGARDAAAVGGGFRRVAPGDLEAACRNGAPGTLFVPGLDDPGEAARQVVRRWFGPGRGAADGREKPGAPSGDVSIRIVGSAGVEPEGLADAAALPRIHLPPLREREGDIPLLVDHFVRETNRDHARRVTGVTRGALVHLETHPWPGNVRELRAMIEGMVVFADTRRPLDVSDLPLALRDRVPDGRGKVTLSLEISLAEAEKRFLEETLRAVGYDRARAAETLSIGLRTLYRKLREYEIG
jgi:DNA-binding NtrC family response regulator